MAFLGWTGDNGDPDNFFYVLLDKDNTKIGSAGNIAFYKSDDVHDLFKSAQMEMDQDKRTEYYMEAQEIIHEDAPWFPIAHTTPPLAEIGRAHRLNSSHVSISYAVFCLKKKK